jgi:1-acyl-sn-glycerol-3-phosphate acyltransferase
MSDDGPVLFLAKHQRWEDIPLLGLAAPRPLCYVAKHELFGYRLASKMLRMLGGIPLNRQTPMRSRESLHRVSRVLNLGAGLVLFPEGTYFMGQMGPGHIGMVRFILNRQTVPVVAVGVQYSKIRGGVAVNIRFGPRRYRPVIQPPDQFLGKLMGEIAQLSGLPPLAKPLLR